MTIKKSPFTLVELLTVVVIIAILAALLLPLLSRVKENARVVSCMNRLHEIAIGYQHYMRDYDGAMPETEYWLHDFQPIYDYVDKSDGIFVCPSSRKNPAAAWSEGNLINGDYLIGGTMEDVEQHSAYNNGHGNNPYHFDPNNPSPQTQAIVNAKNTDRILYEKYWDMHFNGRFFNVVYINDLHYEKEFNGVAAYWTIDSRGWIETSLDPYPDDGRAGFCPGRCGC